MNFKDTDELFNRTKRAQMEVAGEIAKKQIKASIAQAKSALQRYESLSLSEDFQQFLADLNDRKKAAFEAMDSATDSGATMKAVGEYIGVTRAIDHVPERIASLTAFLTDNRAIDSES